MSVLPNRNLGGPCGAAEKYKSPGVSPGQFIRIEQSEFRGLPRKAIRDIFKVAGRTRRRPRLDAARADRVGYTRLKTIRTARPRNSCLPLRHRYRRNCTRRSPGTGASRRCARLQEQAIHAALAGRDSLVVLPTGGGKSLCYQAPAIVRGGLTVVVSPLIALMKDQVDGLTRIGVPAARLDSSLTASERAVAADGIRRGETRLVFISPERLVNTDVYRLLRDAGTHTVAVDEAHCVSHWGHDFRPEYRQLARLREFFPGAAVHGYTATATERVRADIAEQLGLNKPEVLVGNFDRPNLTYRVLPRLDLHRPDSRGDRPAQGRGRHRLLPPPPRRGRCDRSAPAAPATGPRRTTPA